MIFADKLIYLRKKAGWSQEELAEQMNVTRQSVSKWEGGQSIPDLEKIIKLSNLFGVSTDYLLKDDIENTENEQIKVDEVSNIKCVSMEETYEFLSVKESISKITAYAVFLCIISPICLIILSCMSEYSKYNISENFAAGIGMIVLIILVAIAVVIFIFNYIKTQKYEFLYNDDFETEYGVSSMVRERKSQYKDTYIKNNILGSLLCILSFIPLFLGIIINDNDDMLIILMLSLTFIIAGIGVIFLVKTNIIWSSYKVILQEGDYSKKSKEKL